MKTVYGKLALLTILLTLGVMLFAPMRNGTEDQLRVYPQSLRMNRGDAYDIAYMLDSETPQTVSFSSADEGVAMVSADGRVLAVNPGKTQVLVSGSGGLRARVQVEVAGAEEIADNAFALNADSLDMDKGQLTGLRAIFEEGAQNTLVEWSSSDEKVVTVDAIGRVRAVGGGTARVVASTPSGRTASAQVRVHVPGDAVRITPTELTVGCGASFALDTYYLPEDATESIARWTTSAPDVLTVDEGGLMRALKEGTGVISVFTASGLTHSIIVNVESAAADFAVSPTAVTIERGSTLRLAPRFLRADGSEDESASSHYIAWTSSAPEIATVSGGEVIGLGSGVAEITASADGRTARCSVRVEILAHEVRLDRDEVTLLRSQAREPFRLTAEILPDDAENKALTWSTSNELVATVSQDGLVSMTGGYGEAVITARAASGAEAHCTVSVVAQLPEDDGETP